jgi:hypothetical protein
MYKTKKEEIDFFLCHPYSKSHEYMKLQAYKEIIVGWCLIIIGSCLCFISLYNLYNLIGF